MRDRTCPALECLILAAVLTCCLPGALLAVDPADPYWLTFQVSQEIDYPMAPHGYGGFGFAAADCDNDGDVDLYLPTDDGTSDIFLRNVNGVFVDETASFLDSSADPTLLDERSGTALWVDHDGDRFLDLLVLSDCKTDSTVCADTPNARLYRQLANGKFIDVADATGINAVGSSFSASNALGGLSAGDLNEDGLPDFFVGLFKGNAGDIGDGLAHIYLSDDVTDPSQVQYTYAGGLIGNPNVDTWICPEPPPPSPPDCSAICDPTRQGSHWSTIFHDFDGVTIEWPGGTEDPTEIDVPLADLDQVITVGWCGPTDFVAPYGTLDQDDWDEVLALHAAGDPIVDYVPDGMFNQLDLIIASYLANLGCPTATIPINFDGVSTCS